MLCSPSSRNDVVIKEGWLSAAEFTDIVAVSQMTPGPLGINMATYVGYTSVLNAGYPPAMAFLGSLLATFLHPLATLHPDDARQPLPSEA